MVSSEEKQRIYNAPRVLRGEVHRYSNASGWSAYCVVVSANHRAKDKYVSIISLTSAEGDIHFQGDEVMLSLPDGGYWCHCGMITYMRRDRIGEFVCHASAEEMRNIDLAIMQEFGIEGVLA